MEVDESTSSEPVTPLPKAKQDTIIPAVTAIPEIKEEEKIPAHRTNILKIKGINIYDYKLIRVGGGGKCGANCISLHMTGTENMAEDMAFNKNKHIVNKTKVACADLLKFDCDKDLNF